MWVRSKNLRKLSGGAKIAFGNTGDHPLILSLLTQVTLTSHKEDFQSRNDTPSYSPSDRLLVKRNENLIGHVHLSQSIGWFLGERCPLVQLNDFIFLPEFQRQTVRGTEYATALLQAAESTAIDKGAMLAIQHTNQPEWFQQHGWSRCRSQGHTRANTRAVLSHLLAQQSLRRRRVSKSKPATIEIRSWRQIELDCLRHLYQQSVSSMWGALHRSENMWQWLVGRQAHDQIFLAFDHSNQPVGYAILRDSCIIEMFTLPGYSSARIRMIAQTGHDAIDRDHHFVELHTPVNDPMHEVLVTAGGRWQHNATKDGEWMFKLLSPEKWLERIYPVLHQRAHNSFLSLPVEVEIEIAVDGIPVDGQTYQLMLTRRSVRLKPTHDSSGSPRNGRLGCHGLRCDWLTFQDLLTSNLKVSDAIARGQLNTTTPDTPLTLAFLFPFQPFWQSPFELLRL